MINELLRMIADLDHRNIEQAAEIEARAWCWIMRWEFDEKSFKDGLYNHRPKYLSSRDTLKNIRPKDVDFLISSKEIYGDRVYFCRMGSMPKNKCSEFSFDREEYAEFYAILWTMAHLRKT